MLKAPVWPRPLSCLVLASSILVATLHTSAGTQLLWSSSLLVFYFSCCCCCVREPPHPRVAPQSTATPALATCIISSGGKSSLLLSSYLFLFLRSLMMSQSVHKFVLICLFENSDTAAGCTGMKALGGREAKMERRGSGGGGFCLNGFLNDHPLVCIFITGGFLPPDCCCCSGRCSEPRLERRPLLQLLRTL